MAVGFGDAGMDAPFFRTFKHVVKQVPTVPEVIGDTPHVGILLHMLCHVETGRPRRKGKNHVSATVPDGLCDGLYLGNRITAADIVYLYKVYAPGGIEFKEAVVISLTAFGGTIDTVHVRVPVADAALGGNLSGGHGAAFDGGVLMNGLARNSAHHVDAELKPQGVHILRKRCKAFAAFCGREPVYRRHKSGIFIHAKLREVVIIVVFCGGLVPLDIYHYVFPSVLF